MNVRTTLTVLSVACIAACGGGGDIAIHAEAPMSTATAQVAAKIEVAQLGGIVRPDALGHWYVQGSAANPDPDHMPIGIVAVAVIPVTKNGVIGKGLRIDFDRNYTFASTIQVQSDDDFEDQVTAHAGLGLSSAVVQLRVRGVLIDPERIWDYIPNNGGGNLWVHVTMVNSK